MAITGEGTQASPYIITSYADLKQFSTDYSLMGSYLQLNNDLDCKNFVWETIQLKNRLQGGHTYFDLNGHTIKNVSIATNNYMFVDGTSHNTVAHISNGTLQNIYAYTANGITNGHIDFNNVGISCDLSGMNNSSAFDQTCCFHNCGVRIKSDTVLGQAIISQDGGDSYLAGIIEDTDFIVDLKSGYLIRYNSNRNTVKNCRFTGKITQWTHWVIADGYNINNIMDIDFSECTYSGSNPNWVVNQMSPFGGNITSCVVDITNIPSYEQSGGYFNFNGAIQATHDQIRTGSWLRSNNFEVVNVSE